MGRIAVHKGSRPAPADLLVVFRIGPFTVANVGKSAVTVHPRESLYGVIVLLFIDPYKILVGISNRLHQLIGEADRAVCIFRDNNTLYSAFGYIGSVIVIEIPRIAGGNIQKREGIGFRPFFRTEHHLVGMIGMGIILGKIRGVACQLISIQQLSGRDVIDLQHGFIIRDEQIFTVNCGTLHTAVQIDQRFNAEIIAFSGIGIIGCVTGQIKENRFLLQLFCAFRI